MNPLNLFESLPEGFRIVENELDHKLASLTVTQAFADYHYPVPSMETSLSTMMKIYYDYSEQWIDNAERVGLVLTNEDYSAVMVLTPIDKTCRLDLPAMAKKVASLESEAHGKNFLDIMTYIGKDEETLQLPENAIYLEAFAVQTARQGQKLGSKLMRQLFAECDEKKRDIFLFTNTDKNAAIYSHFGYETIKKHRVEELDSTTWFMLRRHK